MGTSRKARLCGITLTQKWFKGSVAEMARVRFISLCQRKWSHFSSEKLQQCLGHLRSGMNSYMFYLSGIFSKHLISVYVLNIITQSRQWQGKDSKSDHLNETVQQFNHSKWPNNNIFCCVKFGTTKRAFCSIRLPIILQRFDCCLIRVWLFIAWSPGLH